MFPVRLLGVLLLSGVWGCDLPSVPRQEQVQYLRVLAIKAEPPALTPGATVTLSALVASPYIQPVRLRWFACKSTGDINGGCETKQGAIDLGSGDTASYKVPSGFIPKDASTLTKYRGRYLAITLVAEAGPQRETATKRVVVNILPMNQNPKLKGLELTQGSQKSPLVEPWYVSRGIKCKLQPKIDESTRESYLTLDTSGKIHTVKEEFSYSWYINGGSLQGGRISNDKTPGRSWLSPSEMPPESKGKARIYLILRDGRGGVDWLTREVQVR